jgi:acyl-CoA synthetase (AMP-forming)/AMP-acid ligase II
MAENVFAVTQTPLDRPARCVNRTVANQNRGALAGLAFDLMDDQYVSSGPPLEQMEIQVRAGSGQPCAEAEPGEILLRTPSLFRGYWGAQGFIRNAISADGWYSTGDYGFLHDGELFVIGRLKDIIIVGGQNIFPEDVELVVNTVAGIYPGRVVSFGVVDEENGTESLSVVAELRGEYTPERSASAVKQIQQLVLAAIGIAPRYVAVVPERWIVKSTAGKISRRDTRERFIRERLPKRNL